MIRKLIITAIIFLAFSCAKDTPPGVIKFEMSKGVPIAKMTLNDRGGKFMIDTGAEISIIDVTLMELYGFKADYSEIMNGRGFGGTMPYLNAYKTVLKYNDSIMPVKFKTANMSLMRASKGYIGIIGSDYLKANDLIIDFSTNEIRKKE